MAQTSAIAHPEQQQQQLFDTSAYKYNAAALSCAQQVQLYQQLVALTSCCTSASSQWGVPHPAASALPPPAHWPCWSGSMPGLSAWPPSYGAMAPGAGCWGSMPAWPQQVPSTMMGAPPPTNSSCTTASTMALHPLPHDMLASLHSHHTHTHTTAATHASASPGSTYLASGGSAPAAAPQAGVTATTTGSVHDDKAPMAASPGQGSALAEDEDLCDDLFRMFADDLDAPVGAPAAVMTSGTTQDCGELSCIASNGMDDKHLLLNATTNTANIAAAAVSTPPAPPATATTTLLPSTASATAAVPPPAAAAQHAMMPHLAPAPAMPTSSSSSAGMFMPCMGALGGSYPHLGAAHYPHLPPPPAHAAGGYTSTVFSASQAFSASRPLTPPAPSAAAHAHAGMGRACSMPTPTSSGSRAAPSNSGGSKAAMTTPLGVHGGGVRKPSSASPRGITGRNSSSSPVHAHAAQALIEGELHAAARAKSPLSGGAVTAAALEEVAGSCSAAATPQQQQQQDDDAALLALDCDNLNHTLDWMDGLPNLA